MSYLQLTYRFIIMVVLILSAQSVLGQEGMLRQKITVDFKEITLGEALDKIEKIATVSFSYSSKKTPVHSLVNLQLENKPLADVLNRLFQNQNIDYVVVENKIILKPADPAHSNAKYTISGYIQDENDGETLLGATILVTSLGKGSISNTYGFYSISLPEGHYQLKYSYIGYQDQYREVDLRADVLEDIKLLPNISQLDEIIVSPDDSTTNTEHIHANAYAIDHETVLLKTSAMGESDVIKTLDIIPGIQLFRDGSTFFNVRGGDRDQNQILVDEAPIYNPAHFMGLFSAIIPESIKDMKMYRGDLPANLGGRLSSVLDIKTRDGNLRRFSTNGSLGLISARLAVEGPIKKDKSSFFISGRRSYIQGIIKSADADIDKLYFSDFTAKANVWLNAKNRLFLSTYLGKDEFSTDGGIAWENKAGTIRWNHVFNSRLFSNITFYSSKYEYTLVQSPDFIWKNHISNVSLKMDFTNYLTLTNTLKFGIKLSGHNFNPGNVEDQTGAIPVGQPFVPKRNATELSLYVSNDQKINDSWLITYGLRLSTWTNIGKTIEYEIDENYAVVDSTIYDTRDSYNDYGNLEPRLSLTYLVDNKNIIKFNYSRAAQYINLISNSISPFNNLEVWMPASVNIKPQVANQISLGWFNTSPDWQLSAELYYKHMENQLDYVNQASILLNPYLEAELRSGDGKAYGLETSLTKRSGTLTGTISYTYSKSTRQIEGINQGQEYVSLWDKPHQFVVNANWKSSPRTTFSGTLYISSGGPITTPTAFYEYAGRSVPIYAARNNDRLPVYHRYDMSVNLRLNKSLKKFNHYLTFSLFNLYAQKNSILINFNKIEVDEKFVVPTNTLGSNPVVSSQVFVYNIVPSISYSFKL
ncbi:MAG: TonB-dependent receptor [Reichenbachiella sp.]|uniref:TonB-dependent receptor n=1 Tax=Reichenbachiella sp. TaxID=2184521 RepID=UPI0032676C44